MTTKQVFTLSAAERDYLQAAVRCMMTIDAEASANVSLSQSSKAAWADSVHIDACKVSRASGVCSLEHEQAADLLCLLGDAADIEVHVPAAVPFTSDEQIGCEAAFVDAAAAAHCRP